MRAAYLTSNPSSDGSGNWLYAKCCKKNSIKHLAAILSCIRKSAVNSREQANFPKIWMSMQYNEEHLHRYVCSCSHEHEAPPPEAVLTHHWVARGRTLTPCRLLLLGDRLTDHHRLHMLCQCSRTQEVWRGLDTHTHTHTHTQTKTNVTNIFYSINLMLTIDIWNLSK